MTRTEIVALLRRQWAKVVVAAAAIVAFFKQIEEIKKAFTAVSGATAEVWSRWGAVQFVVVLGILAATVGILAGIWWTPLAPSLRTMWRVSRRELALRSGVSAALLAAFAGVVTVVLLHDAQPGLLSRLFSQARELNVIRIDTYRNNCTSSYDMMSESSSSFARITLHPSGPTPDDNCGWIVMFQRGTNLSRFQQLRFYVRGSRGDEQIGMKAKDGYGNEVAISLNDTRYNYIAAGKIASTWQQAVIPLNHFGKKLKFDFFENLSLYVRGDWVGSVPQMIDVRDFEFHPFPAPAKAK